MLFRRKGNNALSSLKADSPYSFINHLPSLLGFETSEPRRGCTAAQFEVSLVNDMVWV